MHPQARIDKIRLSDEGGKTFSCSKSPESSRLLYIAYFTHPHNDYYVIPLGIRLADDLNTKHTTTICILN